MGSFTGSLTLRSHTKILVCIALALGITAEVRRESARVRRLLNPARHDAELTTRPQDLRGMHLQELDNSVDHALQRRIIAHFERHDPEPEARRAHFRWLESASVKRIGWNGGVVEARPAGLGATEVRIRIRPTLSSNHPSTFTTDKIDEVYLYDGRSLRFLRAIEGPPTLRAIFCD